VAAGAREALREITAGLQSLLGRNLTALYLFGSLAAGTFVDSRSDLDLLAVLDNELSDAEVEELRSFHAAFAAEHPEWIERVEVGYLSRAVLRSFGRDPAGTMVAISPGEPIHRRDAGPGWVLNWHSVYTEGETLFGAPPRELGPELSADARRRAVLADLRSFQEHVREHWLAYVPAAQGYAVVTICRALHALETGREASKEDAVAWAAGRYPEWAGFVQEALAAHRADVGEGRAETIRFADFAVGQSSQDDSRGEGSRVGPPGFEPGTDGL
jgi:hypothetical protein